MQVEDHTGRLGRDEQQIRRLVTRVGHNLYTRQDEITKGMTVILAGEIEFIGADRPLVEQLELSIRGNVTTLFHAMANEIPIETLERGLTGRRYRDRASIPTARPGERGIDDQPHRPYATLRRFGSAR